jgi:hypothetical protein
MVFYFAHASALPQCCEKISGSWCAPSTSFVQQKCAVLLLLLISSAGLDERKVRVLDLPRSPLTFLVALPNLLYCGWHGPVSGVSPRVCSGVGWRWLTERVQLR